MQTAQELSLPLLGICLAGDVFPIISAQGIGMSVMVAAMAGRELSLLVVRTAQDGPTPPRNTPSATIKAVICRPKTRENMIRTLYAGTRPIKDRFVWGAPGEIEIRSSPNATLWYGRVRDIA